MKIIECPRDAMQGLVQFVPTNTKVDYLNRLLQVGFDTLDAGSFVSAKAIPQLRDTAEVLSKLSIPEGGTRLLVIVANLRGAQEACQMPMVDDIGFPLSLSETFQQRNTNRSIADAFAMLGEMKRVADDSGKRLVVYLSMGFGNPYGDPFEPGTITSFADRLANMGVRTLSLADTVGMATPDLIHRVFAHVLTTYPDLEIGAHLHAPYTEATLRIEAAYTAGCRRFDGALKGFGGCPMAEDKLVGNIPTEMILAYLVSQGVALPLRADALQDAMTMADGIFQEV